MSCIWYEESMSKIKHWNSVRHGILEGPSEIITGHDEWSCTCCKPLKLEYELDFCRALVVEIRSLLVCSSKCGIFVFHGQI